MTGDTYDKDFPMWFKQSRNLAPLARFNPPVDPFAQPPPAANIEELKTTFSTRRGSLADEALVEKMHQTFSRPMIIAADEATVDAAAQTALFSFNGATDPEFILKSQRFKLTKPLSDKFTTPSAPDHAEGLDPMSIPDAAYETLSPYISTAKSRPVAPNFFVGYKGADGSSLVLKNQICWDLAVGGRALLWMNNYPEVDPAKFAYYEECQAVGFALLDNKLDCYGIHVCGMDPVGGPPYTSIQLLKGWNFNNPSLEHFRDGITWFRNACEWARGVREDAAVHVRGEVKLKESMKKVEAQLLPKDFAVVVPPPSSVVLDNCSTIG